MTNAPDRQPAPVSPPGSASQPAPDHRTAPNPRPAPVGPQDTADRRWVLFTAAALVAIIVVAVALVIGARLLRHNSHEISAARGDVTASRFETTSGAQNLDITLADLGDRLYDITTPTGDPALPHATNDHGTVRLTLTGATGTSRVLVRLSTAVRWYLRTGAGLGTGSLDLRAGRVSGLEFAAGTGTIDVRLPKPAGTVPVRLGTGAGRLSFSLPAGVPAAVRIGSGAGTVRLDGNRHDGVAPGSRFTVGAYESAADRYDLDIAAGVSEVDVAHDVN